MRMNRLRLLKGTLLVLLACICAYSQQRPKTPATAKESPQQIEAELQRQPGNANLYIKLGHTYWEENNFPKAFDAFQEATRVGPNSAEAHNWFGVALMQKGDFPTAITEFRKAISLDPKYGRAYTNLGSALSKSGNLTEGVKVFEKALSLEPNSMAAHLNLGIALRENGNAAGALIHLRRVARAEPNNAQLQYEIGQALQQNGDLPGAIAAYEHSLNINPALSETYYALGLALKQQSAALRKTVPASLADQGNDLYKRAQEAAAKGDLETARGQMLQVLQGNDNNADAHSLLGYILGQEGDLDSAVRHLQRAVTLKPDSAEAHYNLGAAFWYKGSKQEAISELETSVKLDPAAGNSYALLSLAQRETGDLQAARLNLERAIALLPPSAATYIDLGIVFLRLGELDKAIGQLEAGLNLGPSSPTPDWDAAISGLNELVEKNPGRADAHNMLGLLLGRKGADSNQVLAEFRKAVSLRPDYAEAHNNIGLVLAQADNDQGAIAEFREAVRAQPNYAEAHANLGAALMFTSVEQAIPEFEKAVSLDPSSVEARFNLAEAYGDSPTHGSAEQIEQLRKVVSMAPTFARAHLALGKALLHDGKVDEAVTQLREAARLDPESGESHYQLGLALVRAGKQSEATSEIQKGRELSAADDRNQNADLDISEGRSELQKGELEAAAAKFQHALKLAPESSLAERYLGMVLEKQGDSASALAAYRKAVQLNPGDQIARQNLNRLGLPETPASSANSKASAQDDPQKIAEFEGYIRQSRFQDLQPLLSDYLKEHPASSWGWYALGYSQFAQKKIGDSIQSLAKSLSLNVENAEAHKILGRDLMVIGRFDAAQTEFEQGIHYAPNSAETHYDLGQLFSLRDNWQEARKQYEAAIRIDSAYVEAIDALGFAQEALGDDAAAIQNYQKAISLNDQQHGSFVAPQVNLSAYYNRMGDTDKALDYAEKALKLDPKADTAWFQKAKAYEHQGRLNDAVDSLNHATSINPRSSTYYYVLAGFYRRLGKNDDSQKALEAFTRLNRENDELEKMRRNVYRPTEKSQAAGAQNQ